MTHEHGATLRSDVDVARPDRAASGAEAWYFATGEERDAWMRWRYDLARAAGAPYNVLVTFRRWFKMMGVQD